MVAAAHLHPALTIGVAIGAAACIGLYWLRLGRDDVPVSRRWVRRVSMGLMLISLPIFVNALSFLRPEVDRDRYVIAWTLALGMVLLVIISAGVDAVNNLRLLRLEQAGEFHQAAADLAKAIRERKQAEARAKTSKAKTGELVERQSDPSETLRTPRFEDRPS